MGQLLFLGDMLKMNTGLQGSTLSGPRMTTGFGPFELTTKSQLLFLINQYNLTGKLYVVLKEKMST